MFGIIAYLTILAVAGTGLAHSFVWAIPLGGLILMAISTVENRSLYRRAYYGSEASQGFALVTMAASFGNGLIACGAAYLLGVVISMAFHS